MIIRQRIYTCWKSEINKPKKVEDITLHCDTTTTKTNCPWQASFNFGKYATAIQLTKFNNIHNHQYDPVTIELAPINQCFPQVVLDKIEHYTVNGHLSAGQQYNFLLKEFSQHHIKKKTCIMQFKSSGKFKFTISLTQQRCSHILQSSVVRIPILLL
jgi:hypothetical protein